jgi:hypothetical protein
VQFRIESTGWLFLSFVDDQLQFLEASKTVYAGEENEERPLRHVPIRVQLSQEPAIQLPIAPKNEKTGEDRTLEEVLRFLLPDLFQDKDHHQPHVVIQGILVPLGLSVVVLYRLFRYPDGFLYVSVLL